jgi:N-dimethylarginine dimethylaminohydrolase
VRGDTALMSSLPGPRQGEQAPAERALRDLGKRIVKAPYRFSGQGDSLPCGNLLFAGSGYRTDPRMHQFVADELGYEVIGVQAVPQLDAHDHPVTNPLTGWPDSFFYDLDLGISILGPDLIAWCPQAWTAESQAKIRATPVGKIEVDHDEALGFACNLVSTGRTVIMSGHAPKLKAAVEAKGLATITIETRELAKGGGFIRCTTLTLD